MSAGAQAVLCSASGQRRSLLGRNIALRHVRQGSTASAMLKNAMFGGRRASGLPLGGIALGQRADSQEFDSSHPALLGLPTNSLFDACFFSAPGPRSSSVWAPGRCVFNNMAPLVQAWQALLHPRWPKRPCCVSLGFF